MRLVSLLPGRQSWLVHASVAVGSALIALLLTHLLWQRLHHTPFLLGFAAAILSARVGGLRTGFLSVIVSAMAYAAAPPALPPDGLRPLLLGFVLLSGTFSWFVARRYEIEADLRASQEQLQAVVSGLPVVLWVLDGTGTVVLAEGSGFQSLGINRGELVGRSLFDQYRDHPEMIGNTQRVLSGETFTATMALGEATVETWYSPRRSADRRVIGAIAVSLDITARRHLEEQYLQAQKMEAVGQLAAGIAHDFNNLLTAIGGYTDLVTVALPPTDARQDDLHEISKATLRAAALTRQLLAFSRRQVLQPTVLDVNATVADMEKLLRRTIPESIDLELQLQSLVPVRADRGQIEQVVLNLAINAGDAMPNGGVLRLTTEVVDVDDAFARTRPPMSSGRYVHLRITDTGTGMSAATQARIFEPFFSTKERGRGTGLGLATVYGIVKQSGGFIWVDSQLGHGTAFDIYLPAVHAPLEVTTPVPRVATVRGGSQTVLLAEDDGAVRRLVSEVLVKHGYTVLDARDGEEALARARQHEGEIHLLITDVVMPGLSGRELAIRLAADRPDIRVLYTSGYSENVVIRAGIGDGEGGGGGRLLTKPFLPSDLLLKVQDALVGPASLSVPP